MRTKGKLLKRVLLALLGIFLAAVLCLVVVLGWYFPHYVREKQVVRIPVQDTGEICMMSYNLRCLTPLDFGTKTWFYRADLIVDDIVEQAPGIIGFQEAIRWQYRYLTDTLSGYDSVITYRDKSPLSEG